RRVLVLRGAAALPVPPGREPQPGTVRRPGAVRLLPGGGGPTRQRIRVGRPAGAARDARARPRLGQAEQERLHLDAAARAGLERHARRPAEAHRVHRRPRGRDQVAAQGERPGKPQVSRPAPAALLFALLPAAASASTPAAWRLAYSAERVSVIDGVTSHGREWGDGVRWKSMSDDGITGAYRDPEKKLLWQWGKGYGCLQMPLADG